MYRNITICIKYKYYNIDVYWLKLYMYMYYVSLPILGFNTWKVGAIMQSTRCVQSKNGITHGVACFGQ